MTFASRTRALALCTALAVVLVLGSCGGDPGSAPPEPDETAEPLAPDEVRAIMEHAARATDQQVVVAVTDRRGVPLGLGASYAVGGGTDVDTALQLARTAAFFSADQTPLTSRSVRFLSGEHFPAGVRNSAAAALFGIENTNRGCAFDAARGAALFDAGKAIPQPVRLGGGACQNGSTGGCTSGIATLPGGVPIYKFGRMVGGVGVFVRGTPLVPDGVASGDAPGLLRRDAGDPRFDVAELAARAFAGDDPGFPDVAAKGLEAVCESTSIPVPACCARGCDLGILPARDLPFDPVIFIDGIEVVEIERNPAVTRPANGGTGITSLIVDPAAAPAAGTVPRQWLVSPRAATDAPAGALPLSAADVQAIITEGIDSAQTIRGAIRLPNEARSAMVLAVSDTNGELLGLFRMDDATVFSIDVAVAKSRNVAYFSSAGVDPRDTRDEPNPGNVLGQAFPPGTAITNRTLGFGAQPFFPSGIDGTAPGPFRTVFIEDATRPCTNGRQPTNGRQNGIVFFPGSAPLYRDGVLVGGLGISGDGVEQDDIVTVAGTRAGPGFEAPQAIRADEIVVRGVRLPYVRGNRQPAE